RAALRVAEGHHGGQEEADRREEAAGAGRSRGRAGQCEDALVEARVSAAAAGVQDDSRRRSGGGGQGAGAIAERGSEGHMSASFPGTFACRPECSEGSHALWRCGWSSSGSLVAALLGMTAP